MRNITLAITIVTAVCSQAASGGKLAINLGVELEKKEYYVYEPVLVFLSLENAGKNIKFPRDVMEVGVISYVLTDKNDGSERVFDAYSEFARISAGHARIIKKPHEELETVPLKSGVKFGWEDNLLNYLDIEPGDYTLHVKLNYNVLDLHIETSPQAITIKKPKKLVFNIHKDHNYQFVQVYYGGKSALHAVNINPLVFLHSGMLPANEEQILSKSSFIDTGDYETEILRWALHKANGKINLKKINYKSLIKREMYVDGLAADEEDYSIELPGKADILAPPVQNKKGELTIVTRTDNGFGSLFLDKQGNIKAKESLASIQSDSAPIVVSSDINENTIVSYGTNHFLPIKLLWINPNGIKEKTILEIPELLKALSGDYENLRIDKLVPHFGRSLQDHNILILMSGKKGGQSVLMTLHVPVKDNEFVKEGIKLNETPLEVDVSKIVKSDITMDNKQNIWGFYVTKNQGVYLVQNGSKHLVDEIEASSYETVDFYNNGDNVYLLYTEDSKIVSKNCSHSHC